MDISIKSKVVVAGVEADESHFWQSFKAVAGGVTIPTQASGYEKGGEYNIDSGMTVVRAAVRGTAGKLVEAFKRYDADDAMYLRDAGFKRNANLAAPTVERKL